MHVLFILDHILVGPLANIITNIIVNTTDQTAKQIILIDGSNDVLPSKEVPFCGCREQVAPTVGVVPLQKTPLLHVTVQWTWRV
jgi:hypothetical protein